MIFKILVFSPPNVLFWVPQEPAQQFFFCVCDLFD